MRVDALTGLVAAALLSACASTPVVTPQEVHGPGMPNAELALQRSLDHVGSFMREFNSRIGPVEAITLVDASETPPDDAPAPAERRPPPPGPAFLPVVALAPAPAAAPGNADFSYRLSGDSPSWRPLRAYSDGGKTFIQFDQDGLANAPTLLVVNSSGPPAPVSYQIVGDSYVVDRVVQDAMLVAGVGLAQQRVVLTHAGVR